MLLYKAGWHYDRANVKDRTRSRIPFTDACQRREQLPKVAPKRVRGSVPGATARTPKSRVEDGLRSNKLSTECEGDWVEVRVIFGCINARHRVQCTWRLV